MIQSIDIIQTIDLLKHLISIPSTSREEEKVADFLAVYFNSMGLSFVRKENNFILQSENFDSAKPTLLLNAHIDTVKPVPGWQHNPYSAIEEDGRIYGLGANDCGGGLVALLNVYQKLITTQQPYNLIYVASAEEEVSGKNGFEKVLPELPPIALAIVGEPTGMKPAVAEKGLMVLDVVAHGKAGHAARNEGVNAIYEALPDVEWLRTYRFDKESSLLGPVKMSVTQISAGTQHNVIPDTCSFVVDVRSNELYSNQELFQLIQGHLKSEVKARSYRLNSSRLDINHPLIERCKALGLEPFGS
ncbi:MAG: M20/M25/M40 family metallo-hydrolase, partial [Bacteroidaceae bacterium]